ncbi:TRAPP II complex [Absidia repens]|uniref:TRAPP II complex n=1 Tax=Absidia repens TaxID=90262 RepID=A0A1X2I3T5_9FUNG|nr:TRAPP II complex [Absidia repens]
MELDINLTSSCRVTVLLVPIYPIKRSVFTRYVKLVREFSTIRLNDVTPDNKSGQVFNNMNFQEGQIHFQFTTHYSGDHDNLIDFQPHRRLFGVIGIMDCQEWRERSLKDGYQQYLESLDKYPSPIVTRCFAFDPTENQPDDTKGLIMIPDVGDKKFYMATLLCDFTSDILSQFSVLAKDFGQQLQSESPIRNTNYATSPLTNQRHSVPQQPYPSTTATESPSRHSVSAANLPSSSGSTSPSTGHASRLQKRIPGRIKKLYADFYLLSGRLPDALSLYIQAIDMTKITSDHLWLASAMEGYVCTTLLLEQLQRGNEVTSLKKSSTGDISANNATQNSVETPSAPESTLTVSFVLDQYNTLLHYYSGNIGNATGSPMKYTADDDNSIPTAAANLIYAEACIKVARFLLTVYLNGNLDTTARYLLVCGTITSPFGQFPSASSASSPLPSPSLPETPVSMTHNATPNNQQKTVSPVNCNIERWDIGLWATRVWEASLGNLTVIDQIHLMTEMTFIYNSIGYRRKAAWLKYQSIQLMLPILLHRQTKSNQDTKGGNTIKSFPSIDRQGILVVLKWICKVYGILDFDSQAGDTALEKQDMPATKIGTRNKSVDTTVSWPSLQLTILRKCIITAESLHAYTDMLYYTTTLMKNMYHYVSKEEQVRLSNSIQRISTLQRRLLLSSTSDTENDEQEQTINYWGVNIVTGIRAIQSIPRKLLHQYPLSRETIINTISGISHTENNYPSDNPIATNNDPFIYNPFTRKKDQKEQILLIKNEIAEFHVSLMNPFGFDLELQSIQLCTSGVSFQPIPHSTILPAYGTSTLCISGVPKESGVLTVLGCRIKIVGFAEHKFLLNQDTLKSEETANTNQKEFNVVTEEPLLKVKSTSLVQGAIMLFEGERAQIKITLENIGSALVDFVALSFTDDASNNDILGRSSGPVGSDLSMEQQYELERISTDRKVFRWRGNIKHNDQTIGDNVWLSPDSTLEISLDIYGRRGCTHGTIKVDYGHLDYNEVDQNLQQLPLSTTFYTRQLYIPVLITVYCHLKPQYWDILYIQREYASGNNARDPRTSDTVTADNTRKHDMGLLPIEQVLKTLNEKQLGANVMDDVSGPHEQNEYCLATIDIQNRWSFPFRVTFSIDNTGEDGDTLMDVDSIIQPGTTSRTLLPIRRFILPENITNQPITLETKKQFVVPQNQALPPSLSASSLVEQENYWRSQLELFWYRENLLRRIKATWSNLDMEGISNHADDEVNRQGDLDLRSCLCLTSEQLSILKVPDVTFAFTLEGHGVKQIGFKHFVCQSGQHVMLTIIVNNKHLTKATKFILRVQPIQNLNGGVKEYDLLQDQLLMEGMNQVILPQLSLDHQARHTIPLYFLAKGRFEFLYNVQDIMTKTTYYDQENTVVDVVDSLDWQ